MSQIFRLGARGIAQSDEMLLMNLTRASVARYQHNWEWATFDEADVMFVPPDTPLGASEDHPVRVPLVPPMTEFLGDRVVLRLPIRPAMFLAVIEGLQRRRVRPDSDRVKPPSTLPAQAAQATVAADAPAATAMDALIERLRSADVRSFQIQSDDVSLLVSPALDKGWMSSEQMPVLMPERFQLVAAPATPPPSHAVPLDAFLWKAVLAQKNPLPARAWAAHSAFGLKRWPDLGRLERDATVVRLVSMLARATPDLAMLEDAAKGDRVRVVNLLNALALLDLLVTKPRENVVPSPAENVPVAKTRWSGGVLSRIRTALGLN